jgi:pyrimidine-nucleoside phosphorylase
MAKAPLSAVDIIARKQQGKALTRREIEWWVEGAASGRIPDYQTSAFLMAVYFRGMNIETGGVGDKVSLILGPLVASVGVHVPMISGRGLGHTGGTLDKLESIPGFRTSLKAPAFERVVRKTGIAIIGQTDEIAPADRKFYAIRDVTSTIRCAPLIVSSILSKKIASGTDAVVFDIKCGEGAFMKTARDARHLAGLLSRVAGRLGLRVSSILTRMDEPLGMCVGNAIEVRESVEVLRGRFVDDLVDLSLTLGAEMLLLAGRTKRRDEAVRLLRTALLGGKALQKFKEMVKAQGGDTRIADDPGRLPIAPHRHTVRAPGTGYIADIDALEVGRIGVVLGAGRAKAEDRVDHAVGMEFLKKKGGKVRRGEAVAVVYASDPTRGRHCARLLKAAIRVSARKPRLHRVILGRVTAKGLARLPRV